MNEITTRINSIQNKIKHNDLKTLSIHKNIDKIQNEIESLNKEKDETNSGLNENSKKK